MIIQSGNVELNSNRAYRQSLSYRYGAMRMTSEGASYGQIADLFASQTQEDFRQQGNIENSEEKANNPLGLSEYKGVGRLTLQDRIQQLEQMRQQTLFYLLRALFGDRFDSYAQSYSSMYATEGNGNVAGNGGLTYTVETTRYYSAFTYEENETTSFAGCGTVVTADGRQIDFSVDLTMSRSFTEMAAEYIDFSQPVLCDPLVINLDADVAAVSDQKFYFDLDSDGEQEQISMLGSGSGFLALDKNGDGVINDGSELFGTQSGNGFADLAEYDEDGNGWIDEADSIFSKLKVWVKDENGEDRLLDLKEAGVGAMYLGSSATQFSLNDAKNTTNAVTRRTGIFLYENGMAGTMQQVDMATDYDCMV